MISRLWQAAEALIRSAERRVAAPVDRDRPAAPTAASPRHLLTALYRGVLGREPDTEGLAAYLVQIEAGLSLDDLVRDIVASSEFRRRAIASAFEADHGALPARRRLGLPRAAGQPASILVVQTADPNRYFDILVDTSRTVRDFCRRHGFRYECFVGVKRGYFDWHAAFNRIVLLKELVESNFSGWVFYLDADAYIADAAFDLPSYLEEKSAYAAIFAHSGMTDVWYDVNDGVFLLNMDSPQAGELIDKWFDAFMEIPEERLSLAPDWGDVPHDQDLLHAVLRENQRLRPAIYLESGTLLNYRDASFVRQFTRGETGGIAERRTTIRQRIDDLIGRADRPGTLPELNAQQAKSIAATLYKQLLGRIADRNGLLYHAGLLYEEGLQTGLPRVVDALVRSEDFRTRFMVGAEPDLNPYQAGLVAAALYRGVLEREPDWHGLAHVPAVLREHGLEAGLQRVVADLIGCDEFNARFRLKNGVGSPNQS